MDRSRVHILLCDHNTSSGSETLHLLRKCSYQVTAVTSARQALDFLNSSLADDVDLFLSEVELPHENGCSMLKHVMGQERLRRIPVVVMSERDEMAVVARCLLLGAVDYLVKPLRSNEVLNLWTHMWRRRRMLGIPDKHAVPNGSGPGFAVGESLVADTSESNNSSKTRLHPGEREKRKRRPLSELDFQSAMPPHLELSLRLSSQHYADPLTEQIGNSSPKESSGRTKNSVSMKLSSKQSEHKDSHASAFVSYTRTNNSSSEQSATGDSNSNLDHKSSEEAEKENDLIRPRPHIVSASLASDEAVASEERADTRFTNSSITEKQSGLLDTCPSSVGLSHGQSPLRCDFASEGASQSGQVPIMPSYQQQPYQGYFVNCASPATNIQHCGFINQPLPSPSLHLYHHENFTGLAAMQSGALPPSHAFPVSNPFSFYSLAPISSPQFVPFPAWPAAMVASTPAADCKLKQAERREAALNKFRLKRKDRCFEKKIRYASRKKLAEQRPRVKGQFVRRVTAVKSEIRDGLYEEQEDEEEDDELCGSELETNSSSESIAESCRVG